MRGQETFRQHDQLLKELHEERAAALHRISRTLQTAIEQLELARSRIEMLQGAERERQLQAYRDLRAHAMKYRWYLEVQREALGLWHHRMLDDFYRIPPEL